MRESSSSDLERQRIHCYSCMRPTHACLCDKLKILKTNTRFVLLMHPKEFKKQHVGTGRMTHLSLPNSEIIVGESFKDCERVNSLLSDERYHNMLLYPGSDSLDITKDCPDISKKTLQIFILDGTWPCAKSMMRESTNLHGIPKISFQVDRPSRFSIKHQPGDYCLSTIESVSELLKGLVKQKIENSSLDYDSLNTSLDHLVSFQKSCAADPNKQGYRRGNSGYKRPSERTASKKWSGRKICFEQDSYQDSELGKKDYSLARHYTTKK